MFTLKEIFGHKKIIESAPNYEKTDIYAIDGMTSIFYEGARYKDRKNKVYAYYKVPEGLPPSGGWPAVVLVHGGGGTAFPWMIEAWNKKGFAAIAMDLEGHLPQLDMSHELRSAHERSGPTRKEIFEDDDLPINEQWFYHAIADTVIAHSLIRSFEEVNEEKVGIFGISWGGIITSTVLGLDHRFSFGISGYGCGYYGESDGILKPQGDEGIYWDPANYLELCKVPVLFVNGSNDQHFPLNTWQKTTALVDDHVWRYISITLGHDHKQPYNLIEPFAFARDVVTDKLMIPSFVSLETINDVLHMEISNSLMIRKATLCYTKDVGKRSERKWHTTKAEIHGKDIKALVPKGSTAYFLNILNVEGNTFSSDYIEIAII